MEKWGPKFRWKETSVSFGTIVGRHWDSCWGAQYAIAPSNCTLLCLVRHALSSRPWTDHEHKPKPPDHNLQDNNAGYVIIISDDHRHIEIYIQQY